MGQPDGPLKGCDPATTLALHGPGRFSLDGWLGEYLAALGKPFTGVDADLPHVVIIGGGFGFARHGLDREFRSIEPASARVLPVQSAPRLLPTFPEALSADASRALLKLGVEMQLKRKVDHVDVDGVVIGGERIRARTVLWAAGVTASAAGQWLRADTDATGRLKVGPALTLPGTEITSS
jgi:NADH dehydrogenase FAD-containing subunit